MTEYARYKSDVNLVGRSRLHLRQESNSESVYTECGIKVLPRVSQRPRIYANRETKCDAQSDDTRVRGAIPSSNRLTAPSACSSDQLTTSLSTLELNLSNFTSKFDV
ncbi:hypothetical protein PENSUB_13569 [Penicillium subrubescens]|uniref:Uncharacterized protein n=1 Tax=Penicillium subrubescens TaxID=1316194 RepID=A0A1Q5SPA5_9EURO|nr:hypothetical protein PENSUB_13569 [Penicillium subrubescens]